MTILALVLTSALTGCSKEAADTGWSWADSGYAESDADSDTDADSDSDSDADSDTDSDTDTDVEDSGEPGDTGVDDECDEDTPVELYLSPDDSNSMASPVLARESVLGGKPLDFSVRTYEFMNYYSWDYPEPDDGVHVDLELVELSADTFEFQIGVTSPERTVDEREPMNLVLCLDTSGSMSGTPMNLLREVGYQIAGSLRAGDVVSIVEWDTEDQVVLGYHEVSGPDDAVLVAAIEGLQSGGGTDLAGGLDAAYELAEAGFTTSRINRVVLVSDGGANVGVTSSDLIGRYAGSQDEEGVYLVGVGVGLSSTYKDELMDTVTDLGKGAAVFIGDTDEAEKIFGPDGFVNTMDVAARNVQVQLDLPPGFEIKRTSAEEVSSNPRRVEPQHLAPNDSMVFFQELWTCDPEALTAETEIRVTATWTDPVTFEERSASTSSTLGDLVGADNRMLHKGRAVFLYAEAIKAVRAGYGDAAVLAALAAVARAEASNPGDADLAEIRTVLEAL